MFGEGHWEYRKSINQLGIDYFKNANYDEALKNYFQNLLIYKENGDWVKKAVALNNIGIAYSNKGADDLALKYF
jgi:hypothetical protein